jgi:hypothetical protein
MVRTATSLPFRMSAARRRSSIRALVQLPRKAWWIFVPFTSSMGA